MPKPARAVPACAFTAPAHKGRTTWSALSLLNAAGRLAGDKRKPDGGSRALLNERSGSGCARLFGSGVAQTSGALSISVPGAHGKGQMTPSPLSLLNGAESTQAAGSGSRWNRRRSRSERFLDRAHHLFPLSLHDRQQPAELEARQLDVAEAPQRLEAEVCEEIRRKDRLVHQEALVLRLPFAIAVRKRLERLRAAISCIPDRGEEERLHHPRARGLDKVGARHQNRVVRRRPGRKLRGTRE